MDFCRAPMAPMKSMGALFFCLPTPLPIYGGAAKLRAAVVVSSCNNREDRVSGLTERIKCREAAFCSSPLSLAWRGSTAKRCDRLRERSERNRCSHRAAKC